MSDPKQVIHDRELANSLRNAAHWADKRSLKLATILRAGADRIEQLSGGLDPKPKPAPQPEDSQPASAPQ